MRTAKTTVLVVLGNWTLAASGLAQAQGPDAPSSAPATPTAMESSAEPPSGAAPDAPVAAQSAAPLETVPVDAAKSEEPAAPKASSGNRMVEEIIVTAQKREEGIRDVPISISAFSGDQLEAKQVLSVQDLPKVTPGLTVTTVVGHTALFIRGVGSDATILGDPLVVTYVDNVYFPSAYGQAQDYGPLEGIEVLKGPQGTLFGRNALGGAIRVKSKDPSLETAEGQAGVERSSFDSFKGRAYVSVPLNDTFAFGLSGLYSSADNHIDGRIGPPNDRTGLPKETQKSFRLKTLWKPADWMDLRLNYYGFESDGASTFSVNTVPSPAGMAAGIVPQDPRKGINDDRISKPVDVKTYFGQLSFYMPWADVKLFGSKQNLTDGQHYDFDGSEQPIAVFQAIGFTNAKTGELQITSNADTPGAEWLDWVAGMYYFSALSGFRPAYLWAGGTDLTQGIVGGIAVPPDILTLINQATAGIPVPAGARFKFNGIVRTKSLAYYSQATAHFTDSLSLTLGARYQNEKRILDDSSAGVALLNGDRIVYQSYNGYDDPMYRGTTKKLDPKVSLNFKPAWDWAGGDPLFYVSYQSATTSLAFNAINILDAPEKVKASEIKAYEAGMKVRLFDGLMDLNAAAFQYNIKDPQVQTISLLAGGAVRFENAESERIRGFEFDSLVRVFPDLLDDTLVLTAAATFLDPIYTSFKDGSGFAEGSGLYQDGLDFTGNQIVRSPKFSGNVGLLKTFPTSRGPIEAGVDYYYNSGFPFLAQGKPDQTQKSYGLLAANISFLYEPWNTRITVFGRNLTNADYGSRFPNDFGTLDIIAPPATYGVSVGDDF